MSPAKLSPRRKEIADSYFLSKNSTVLPEPRNNRHNACAPGQTGWKAQGAHGGIRGAGPWAAKAGGEKPRVRQTEPRASQVDFLSRRLQAPPPAGLW